MATIAIELSTPERKDISSRSKNLSVGGGHSPIWRTLLRNQVACIAAIKDLIRVRARAD
jgi:hypothetical protein